MGALREILAVFDVEVDPSGKMKKADSTIDGLKKRIDGVVGVLGAAALVQGFRGFVGGLADAGDQIIDNSAKLGLSTESFQRWGLAAKLSGVDAGSFAGAVQKMQAKVSDAAANGAKTGGVFKELGVDLRDSAGNIRSTEEILGDTGIAISKLSGDADKTKKSMDAFGKSGAALIPMFAGGSDGLNDLLSEFDRLGGGYSEAALERMGELGDNTDRFEFALTSLKGEIAVSVLPALNNLIAGGAKLVGGFKGATAGTQDLKAAIVVLGSAGAIAGARMLTPWLPLIALMAGAYLVVDDLLTALDGGESVAGKFFDALLGDGAGVEIFAQIKADIESLNTELGKTPGLWNKIKVAGEAAGSGIADIWETDLPEAISAALGPEANKSIERGWKQLWQNLAGIVDEWIAGLKGKIEEAIGIPITDIQRALGIDPHDAKATKNQAALDDAKGILKQFGALDAAARANPTARESMGLAAFTQFGQVPGAAAGGAPAQPTEQNNNVQQSNQFTIEVTSEELAEQLQGTLAEVTMKGAKLALSRFGAKL